MKFYYIFIFILSYQSLANSSTITVTSNKNSGPGSLRDALDSALNNDTIKFRLNAGSTRIKLNSPLPYIEKNLTIEGANGDRGRVIVDGAGAHPGFFVKTGTVTISNLTLEKCALKGGRGGNGYVVGGGGGMGAGGGIFVNEGTNVTLTDVIFNECKASGGSGGNAGESTYNNVGGGGGGLGGAGSGGTLIDGGGGGGLFSDADGRSGGTFGGDGQRLDGAGPDSGQTFGGGGGTNGLNFVAHNAGDGGFAGGGGGAVTVNGGDGGTGGGGGASDNTGGTGGKFYDDFGGGNGGIASSGNGAGGGGGAGVGGAVFVREGGTLSFNSDITQNQSVKPGTGGTGGQNGKNGSADGAGIYIMNLSHMTLNTTDTKSISAKISGQGGIIKTGVGTYILTDSNNYTGTTQINAGTLIVNGSIQSSSVTVGALATLRGAATVGPLTVNGIVRPGNSIGTIKVIGDYTQNANSTYQVEIDSTGGSSKLDITGFATIFNPSTLEVIALSGEYDIDHTYLVLHVANNGLTGQYSTFTITNPNELDDGTLTLSYTSNSVVLTFLTNPIYILGAATSLSIVSNGILNQVNHLQSDLGFEQSILRYYQSFCPCKTKKIRPYFLANYLHGHYKNSTYTTASDFSLSGALLGIDFWSQTDLIIGGFFNYLRGWSNTSNNKLRSTCNNYIISFYVQKIFETFFIESEISSTYSDIRKARLSNNKKINESKPDGFGFSCQTRAARILKYKNFIFLPNLALRYFYNYIDSYKEKFDIASRFEMSSASNNILEAIFSSNFSYRYLTKSSEFIPQIEISYITDLLKEKIFLTSTRIVTSEKTDHTIKANPKNCIKLKGALDYRFNNCSLLNLSYIASFSTNQRITNEVHFGFRVDF